MLWVAPATVLYVTELPVVQLLLLDYRVHSHAERKLRQMPCRL